MSKTESKPKIVLVTGAAGYLGRCMSHVLQRNGFEPVGLDNFSTSKKPESAPWPIVETDLCDLNAVRTSLAQLREKPVGVIHFAARALVSESCENPGLYFRNNILATTHMAEVCAQYQIPHLVHSSSCAVYGIPKKTPIQEDDPLGPVSPYGETKRISEQILDQYAERKGLSVVHLRYFNPAGALNDTYLGELHEPETHLIPNLVRAALEKAPFHVYGTDYPTRDGSCIRDLIHVEDLCLAHLKALEFLNRSSAGTRETINLGSGVGTSVREALRCMEKLHGKLNMVEAPRRPGDPPELVADITKAKALLDWGPLRSLDQMVGSHYQFFRRHQDEQLNTKSNPERSHLGKMQCVQEINRV